MSCRCFSRALAVAAVLLVACRADGSADLVAYWPLNETSGTTAYDATGTGHDADAVTNSSPWGINPQPPTPGNAGPFGNGAWQFYGDPTNTSALACSTMTGLVGDQGLDFTLNAWVNPTASAAANWQPRLFQTEQGISFGTEPAANRMYCYVSPGFGTDNNSAPLSPNQWHMATATYNYAPDPNSATGYMGTVSMYMDGALLDSQQNGGWQWDLSWYGGPQVPLMLGGHTRFDGFSFDGLISDMGYWKKTLTDVQVAAMYNTPLLTGLSATGLYGQGVMDQLFDLYDAGTGSVTIGSLTWGNVAGLTGHNPGDAWANNGVYYVELDANGTGVATAKALHPGDANGDGAVDILDLNKLLTNFDKSGMTWSQGDFDGNRVVDILDLNKLLTNFDKTFTSAGIKAVPEPSALLLAFAGLIVLAASARRRWCAITAGRIDSRDS
jgi:hypothetical protein